MQGFRYRCYTKSELAALYMPGVNSRSALKTLRRWMYRNSELMATLRAAGYRENDRILSPLQVRAIVRVLGEPLE